MLIFLCKVNKKLKIQTHYLSIDKQSVLMRLNDDIVELFVKNPHSTQDLEEKLILIENF